MNRKQFALVLLGLAIIGAACLCLVHRNDQTWAPHEARVGDKIFGGFQVNDVAEIHIKGASDFHILQKSGGWSVPERANYLANRQQITDLLMRIKELKVIQSDLVGPSQLGALELNAPGANPASGTLFEFKNQRGEVIRSLLVGKRHMRAESASDPFRMKGLFDSCYVLLPSEPGNVLLVSDDLAPAVREPGSWLKRDFFKVENLKVISLIAPNAADSWEISRESESSPWVLANAKPGEVLNPKIASETAEILAFPTFVDVLGPSKSAGVENTSPFGSGSTLLTVLADYCVYTLKISPRRADGTCCMKVNVTANIPAQRTPGPDESAEDRDRAEKAFQASQQVLRARLAKEQALSSWIYVVDSWIDMVNRKRAQLTQPQVVAGEQSAGS